MNEHVRHALSRLVEAGDRLSGSLRFDWPVVIRQAVHRLVAGELNTTQTALAALVGGASSGKSTVFNNLLDGHLTSRITARGHSTLGPILAIHEDHRPTVLPLLASDRLLPGFRRVLVELDGNVCGEPDAVAVLFHPIDALRDVWLIDLPDFTSEAALAEGDIALSLLPWLDRLVVVLDHERWYDRQAISKLRAESVRFGQQRWALFNRTCEGTLGNDDRASLAQQAAQLSTEGMSVLEFRRGRGFRRFSPGTFDDVLSFLSQPAPPRTSALFDQVSEAANRVVSQNEERAARLKQLERGLTGAIGRAVPDQGECLSSLMTPDERRQVDAVSRVLRIPDTKRWLSAQARRVSGVLRGVPLVGAIIGPTGANADPDEAGEGDRITIAMRYFAQSAARSVHEVNRAVRTAAFWDEVRRWTGLEPAPRQFEWNPSLEHEVRRGAQDVDGALSRWLEKVDNECAGMAPHVKGALGMGAVGLTVVLIAAPGPVAALTLLSAKGAIAGALSQLVVATGAGALFGKAAGRMTTLVQEKLLGSPEFDAVQQTTAAFRTRLESHARGLVDAAMAEAAALVLPPDDSLLNALSTLQDIEEGTT